MSGESIPDVLIVGAGPVGMTSALLLNDRGVKTSIIDAAGGTATRSYACALHPYSLELLDRFGLIGEILDWGRRIDAVAFYEGLSRKAEVTFADLPSKFPFAVILPQNALEWMLERTLNRRAGIKVRWHHRLRDLHANGQGVSASVDRLSDSPADAKSAKRDPVVKGISLIESRFVVGADGFASLVRRSSNIGYEQVGESELFGVYEFETDIPLEQEARVVMDDAMVNVLWPISGKRCRWSFQMPRKVAVDALQPKDRHMEWVPDPETSAGLEQRLRQLIGQRAPWFKGRIKSLDWAAQVQFDRRLAARFGDGRCWLAGDAAHQVGPVGVQSFNVGLREASDMADTIANVLSGRVPADAFQAWDRRWREEWRRLFGLDGGLQTSSLTSDWVRQRGARLISCLPVSGGHITQLLEQLHCSIPGLANVASPQ